MVIISGLSRMPQTKQTLNIEYGLVVECVNKCYRKTQNLFSDEISREEWMQRSFLYLKHVKNFSNCARLHKANTWFTCNACFVPPGEETGGLLLLLLLLSHFSHVRLCATLSMAAHRAPPSLGFSRREHWRGLPFPSPMPESEKWEWSRSILSDS